jgi:hypothetical protein
MTIGLVCFPSDRSGRNPIDRVQPHTGSAEARDPDGAGTGTSAWG